MHCLRRQRDGRARHRRGEDRLSCRGYSPPADLEAMQHLRKAFDPEGLLNPGKLFTTGDSAAVERPGAVRPGDDVMQHRSHPMTMTPPMTGNSSSLTRRSRHSGWRCARRAGSQTPGLSDRRRYRSGPAGSAIHAAWPGAGVVQADAGGRLSGPRFDDYRRGRHDGRAPLANSNWPPRVSDCRSRLPMPERPRWAAPWPPTPAARGVMASAPFAITCWGCGRWMGGGRVCRRWAGGQERRRLRMCRLLIGSWGTLGVITQVTLMVRPELEAWPWWLPTLPDFTSAKELLAELPAHKTGPWRLSC